MNERNFFSRYGREASPLRVGGLLSMVALMVAWAQSAAGADVFNGRQVYDMHCQTCHGDGGVSVMPGTPNFANGDQLFKPDTDLFEAIRNGKNMMPGYRGLIEDSEILDVIAYLRTLQQ